MCTADEIVFGCFDLIVTPNGDVIFLEVNPMGQFLWIEYLCPEIQLLELFCEFLLAQRFDFTPQGLKGVPSFPTMTKRPEWGQVA